MSYIEPGYPTLTYSQLEGVWKQASAGDSQYIQSLAPLMAAIAMAESGGHAGAVNNTDNNGAQDSTGLWQVSTGTHQWYSPNILNPLVNAQVAIQKIKDQGLSAWSTYDSGAYQQYMQGSVPATPYTGGAETASYSIQPGKAPKPPSGSPGGLWNDIWNWLSGQANLNSLSLPPGTAPPGSPQPLIPGQTTPNAVAKGVGTVTGLIGEVASTLLWFVNPSHWLRIFSGIGGAILLVIALHFIATSN